MERIKNFVLGDAWLADNDMNPHDDHNLVVIDTASHSFILDEATGERMQLTNGCSRQEGTYLDEWLLRNFCINQHFSSDTNLAVGSKSVDGTTVVDLMMFMKQTCQALSGIARLRVAVSSLKYFQFTSYRCNYIKNGFI